MKLFRKYKLWIELKLFNIRRWFEVQYYKRKYDDFEDNPCNIGPLKLIWGVQSWDDLSSKDVTLYTMNDIDITYDRKNMFYLLGIETHYLFNNREQECDYLKKLLLCFEKFMDDNGYYKYDKPTLFLSQPIVVSTADSIEDLFINFKMFVHGYCSVCGYSIEDKNKSLEVKNEIH